MEHDLSTRDEEALLTQLGALVRTDRQTTADLVACIGEIDRRKLYAKYAYPSMFAFCVERFCMSEAIAFKRIRAGRVASRFPLVLPMLERGELHLSGLHRLAVHLTEANHQEVLARAKHKTTRQIEALVAEIAPEPDVRSRIRRLPRAAHGEVTPLSPRRYKLEVTIDEEAHRLLRALQDLMSHQVPNGDPAAIVERAIEALHRKVLKKKTVAVPRQAVHKKKTTATQREGGSPKAKRTAKTSPSCRTRSCSNRSSDKTRTRTLPTATQRAVFARDGGQCRYVDERGNRCKARRYLEYHHVVPFGRGGGHGVDNLELRCWAHNQYEAELVYGQRFMQSKRSA